MPAPMAGMFFAIWGHAIFRTQRKGTDGNSDRSFSFSFSFRCSGNAGLEHGTMFRPKPARECAPGRLSGMTHAYFAVI